MWKRWGIGQSLGGPFIGRLLREERGTVAALVAGLLLRAAFVAKHALFGGDALLYADLAHNLRLHHVFGFTQEDGIRPTLIRLPGYPLFLAACFALFGESNFLAVLWIQVAVDLGTCLLLSRLATRLFGPRAGLATLWLAALCPFTANYATVPITECWSLFCVALAFYALERSLEKQNCWLAEQNSSLEQQNSSLEQQNKKLVILSSAKDLLSSTWPITLGLSLAFAVLLRPDQGLLATVILPVMLWVAVRKRFSIKALLPIATTSFILILPLALWAGRNAHVFHVFQPLAPRYANDPGEPNPYGFQRWFRTWAIDFKATVDVYWTYDGSTVALADLPPRAFDTPAQRAATAAIYNDYNRNTTSTPALDAAFARLAADRIAAHPLRYYVLLPTARVLNMWLRPRTELMRLPVDWWNWHPHPVPSVEALAYALLNAAYLALGLFGLWRWYRSGWSGHPALAIAMVGFVAARCLLLLTLDNSEPRYTLECFPLVLVLAGFAFTRPYPLPPTPQNLSS